MAIYHFQTMHPAVRCEKSNARKNYDVDDDDDDIEKNSMHRENYAFDHYAQFGVVFLND